MRSVSCLVLSTFLFTACATVDTPSFRRASVDPTVAQDASGRYGPEPGESILQFGGALTSQTTDTGVGGADTNTNVTLQGGIGWFQSEWLEIGGQLITDYSDSGTTLISIAPYANANFRVDPRLWLYAGPHLGLGYFDFQSDDAVSLQYGLHGGARYWVDPRTSVFSELRYTRGTFEINSIDIDTDTVQLLFGFSVVF